MSRTMNDVTPEDLEVARAAYEAYTVVSNQSWPPSFEALPNYKKLAWVEASDAANRKMMELSTPPGIESIERRSGDLVVYGGGL